MNLVKNIVVDHVVCALQKKFPHASIAIQKQIIVQNKGYSIPPSDHDQMNPLLTISA